MPSLSDRDIIERFARRVSNFTGNRHADRLRFEEIMRTLASEIDFHYFNIEWGNGSSPIGFDSSAWVFTFTNIVFEKPELAYRSLREAEQLTLMIRALAECRVAMPDQFAPPARRLTTDGLTQIIEFELRIPKAAFGPDGRVRIVAHGSPATYDLDFAKKLLASNFSPGRMRATARESFFQPDLEDLNRIVRAVQAQIQHSQNKVAPERQKLTELLKAFQGNSDSFLTAIKSGLPIQWNLPLLTDDEVNFPASLKSDIEHILGGGCITPAVLSRRLQQQLDFMRKYSKYSLQLWNWEVVKIQAEANDKGRPTSAGVPMPGSLTTLREIVTMLEQLMPKIQSVALRWFSLEIPDPTDRHRFISNERTLLPRSTSPNWARP